MFMRIFPAVLFTVGFLFLGNVSILSQTCAEKDYDCKITYYQGLIKTNPKEAENYYSLAIAFQNKKDYEHAITALDVYLSSNITNNAYAADGYSGRADAKYFLKQYDGAIADYTEAINRVPSFGRYYFRGRAYTFSKKFDLAAADFTRAISLKPDYSSAYFERGYAYMELKDYPKSEADFTKVISLDPANVEAYYNRGTLYYRTKEYAKSIADLDKYIALSPADKNLMADGYENRGLAFRFSGNAARSVEDLTKAIELAPTKNRYLNRAAAYRLLKKVDLADADEKKAATIQ